MTALYDYSNFVKTAKRLIKRFGRSATLTKKTTSGESYDPIITKTDYAIILVETSFEIGDMENTLIQGNDKKVIVSLEGLAVSLTEKDIISDNGIDYEIKWIMPLQPGPNLILYKALLRK